MSPTADQLAKEIGRDLQEGDILTPRYGHINVEVVNPGVVVDGKNCVSVAELTPHGRVEKTEFYSRTKNVWNSIVRKENRTDGPLRER